MRKQGIWQGNTEQVKTDLKLCRIIAGQNHSLHEFMPYWENDEK